MSNELDDRRPWWGLLIEGDLEEVSVLAEIAIQALELGLTPGDYTFVRGKGWTGMFVFRKEPPFDELADALRIPGGREIVILELGDVPWVRRWHGKAFEFCERDPWLALDKVGIQSPGRVIPERPHRFAALIEGAPVSRVRELVARPEHLIETERGIIVLHKKHRIGNLHESPEVTIHEVTHYLDTHEFHYSLYRGDDAWAFPPDSAIPTFPESQRTPTLDSVEGETDPRAIVRKLGIPEDYMFPPSTN